nr:flagellin [Selenomonas ruminantium]
MRQHMLGTYTKGVCDRAIDYLLDAQTLLGAQAQRLEATRGNIIIAAENEQASESVIRDADMAKEMTGYAKANILSQTAQSMLAQANQTSSSVLGLLQ